jgi:hypothetical protein
MRHLAKLDYEIQMLKIDVEELLTPSASDDFIFKLFYTKKKTDLDMKQLERKLFIKNSKLLVDGRTGRDTRR